MATRIDDKYINQLTASKILIRKYIFKQVLKDYKNSSYFN